ncbi:MAG: hypothetical protein U1F34_02740 [Gammaproteobacteria bacterium]
MSGASVDPEALAKLAVQNDWGLVELAPQGQSLEELFVQMTAGEISGEAA